ncbi:MAG: hypothetical protein WCK09_03905 [Bacteroidota bacterium]
MPIVVSLQFHDDLPEHIIQNIFCHSAFMLLWFEIVFKLPYSAWNDGTSGNGAG